MAEEDAKELQALDDDRDEIESVEPTSRPGQRETIRPFADLQRQLAAIDFPAIRAAQRKGRSDESLWNVTSLVECGPTKPVRRSWHQGWLAWQLVAADR